jgi:hypothetical protein
MVENHAGSAIAMAVVRRMLRFGGNPELWLAQFSYKVGLLDRDRNYHELRGSVLALNAFGTVDQYNMGASVGIEILCCRLASIAEALKSGADRPSWNRSGEIENYDEPTTLLPPERRAEVAKAAKDRLDTASLRDRLNNPKAGDSDLTVGLGSGGGFGFKRQR